MQLVLPPGLYICTLLPGHCAFKKEKENIIMMMKAKSFFIDDDFNSLSL